MRLTALTDLGYTVFKTDRGWAIGLTQEQAQAQEDLYQFPSKEECESALEMSFSES